MFQGLFGWIVDTAVRRQHRRLPTVDWEALYTRIRGDVEGYRVFIERRSTGFIPVERAVTEKPEDVVGLAVAWVQDGVPPWDTEEPAKQLAEKLSKRFPEPLPILLSRDPDSLVGYYVRIGY